MGGVLEWQREDGVAVEVEVGEIPMDTEEVTEEEDEVGWMTLDLEEVVMEWDTGEIQVAVLSVG